MVRQYRLKPNAVLRLIHNRMPVIQVLVEAFPVSTQVNNVRNDAAKLMEPMNPA